MHALAAVAIVLGIPVACSTGSSSSGKSNSTIRTVSTTCIPKACQPRSSAAPTPDEEVTQCQRFGAQKNLEYVGIDGLAAGARAHTIAAELHDKRLSAAPWDAVNPDEFVYACQFARPPTTHKLRCADGNMVPDKSTLRLFVDASGRSGNNLLDQRPYC